MKQKLGLVGIGAGKRAPSVRKVCAFSLFRSGATCGSDALCKLFVPHLLSPNRFLCPLTRFCMAKTVPAESPWPFCSSAHPPGAVPAASFLERVCD